MGSTGGSGFERERPLVALGVAAALHGGLIVLAALVEVPAAPAARERAPLVEVELGSWEGLGGQAESAPSDTVKGIEAAGEAPAAPSPSALSLPAAPRVPRTTEGALAAREPPAEPSAATPPSAAPSTTGASGDGDGAGATTPGRASEGSPSRGIALLPGSAADRLALLRAIDAAPAVDAAPPSVRLLQEGLAQRDAEKGLARSSAAVAAGYRAARRYAPETGTAVFEIHGDPDGLVQRVLLVSPDGDERWEHVREALQALLGQRRLRVPEGRAGVVARLRIDRGELALTLDERDRTERRPALGEEPLDPREDWPESTRASIETKRLSPSLGVSSEVKPHPTRVTLLSERFL